MTMILVDLFKTWLVRIIGEDYGTNLKMESAPNPIVIQC